LAALVGAVAAILLIWAFIRGSLPAAYSAAAVLLPVAAYGLASMHMLEGSKQTEFCGSCHVMTPVQKSVQGNDGSLASIHYARGLVPHDQACYTCHSGYGIWGGVDARRLHVTGRHACAVRHQFLPRLSRLRGEFPRRRGAPRSGSPEATAVARDELHGGVSPASAP
jgi:hypothetical protein